MRRTYHAMGIEEGTGKFEQGFIDQFGDFYNRQEAMQIAKEAAQDIDIERGCGGNDKKLYSEGLY